MYYASIYDGYIRLAFGHFWVNRWRCKLLVEPVDVSLLDDLAEDQRPKGLLTLFPCVIERNFVILLYIDWLIDLFCVLCSVCCVCLCALFLLTVKIPVLTVNTHDIHDGCPFVPASTPRGNILVHVCMHVRIYVHARISTPIQPCI